MRQIAVRFGWLEHVLLRPATDGFSALRAEARAVGVGFIGFDVGEMRGEAGGAFADRCFRAVDGLLDRVRDLFQVAQRDILNEMLAVGTGAEQVQLPTDDRVGIFALAVPEIAGNAEPETIDQYGGWPGAFAGVPVAESPNQADPSSVD